MSQISYSNWMSQKERRIMQRYFASMSYEIISCQSICAVKEEEKNANHSYFSLWRLTVYALHYQNKEKSIEKKNSKKVYLNIFAENDLIYLINNMFISVLIMNIHKHDVHISLLLLFYLLLIYVYTSYKINIYIIYI